jgi:hypothetical protein
MKVFAAQTATAYKHSNGDVFVYHKGELIGKFPSHYSNKPKKKHKYVTINCTKFSLRWVD